MGKNWWRSKRKGANLNTKLADHPLESDLVCCYFRDLESRLVTFIEQSPSVVICMAWVTSQPVVKALVDRPCVLILQNESWLNKKGGLAKKTRDMYASLRNSKDKVLLFNFEQKTRGKAIKKDIRVAGMISHPQNMHHKFAVRLDEEGKPLAVWTGSFNPTTNGNQSIENALVLHNEEAARAYLDEFLQVYGISKPLKV